MGQDVLEDKVALVTGAARGLGLHFAEALVGAGVRVAMVGRSADELKRQAERLGPAALAVPTDISDPDAVTRAMSATVEAFGGLDILINSATLNKAHKVEQITNEELTLQVGVNICGAIYLMREAVPLMRARGGGDIVSISSESVLRPFPFLSLYAACKAAIENLVVGMREEVRHDNIRVTTLRSGSVDSGGAFLEGNDPERLRQFQEASIAGGYLHDVGTPFPPKAACEALISLLSAPRGAHIDLISVRAI